MKRITHTFAALGMLLLLSACNSLTLWQWDQQHGQADASSFNQSKKPLSGDVSYKTVQGILEARCAVCHGCYDAPCQLKLTAWEGIARGASPDKVYDGTRLKPAQPSRLFEDAFLASSWRSRNFHAVLNERPNMNAIDGSVLAQILLLKQQNPLPNTPQLAEKDFDFSLDRAEQCTTIENFASFSRKNPLWGMPFGLPGLPQAESDTLLKWIAQGAPREAAAPLSSAQQAQIAQWENWLNADSLKAQLVARYIYEHLFLAHLHFGDEASFFKLVRSRTPSGQAVDLISTTRPYDAPGVARVYYRIIPVAETILSKTHMPYRLDAAKLRLWQQWFVDTRFNVKTLPSYDVATASNPFVTFAAIPAQSRYRFMLEEAQFTVMGFIKGPVCRGQQALNVINDHFWVFFQDPNLVDNTETAEFLAENSQNLRLPAELDSASPILGHWEQYAEAQQRYLATKAQHSKARSDDVQHRGAELIWNGSGRNQNAALTIFRHFDSASVEQGLIGQSPQTAWVIGYPLLERFHYLLVAGYDVYGNVGHQLKSRLYMDFLRIEGEQNFLSLLPDVAHSELEQRWYRDAPKSTLNYITASRLDLGDRAVPNQTQQSAEQAMQTLIAQISSKMGAAIDRQHDLQRVPATPLRKELQQLADLRGASLQWLPQSILIQVQPAQGPALWLSLLNNSANKNVAQIFFEGRRRLPAEDTLTLAYGFVGAYPNAFWRVNASSLPDLRRQISQLNSEADYRALMDQYGVRRTSNEFWPLTDQAHRAMQQQQGIAFGLLDLNRLENR